MASASKILVYISCSQGQDAVSWIDPLRRVKPSGGVGMRSATRLELAGNWQPIQAAIGQSHVVIADFSPTKTSGDAPDPDVVTEATLARFGLSPKPVIVLHRQRFEQLPTCWRLLHGDAGVRFAPMSGGIDPIKQHMAAWLGELSAKPLPANFPFRNAAEPPEIYVSQSFQRGDGAEGPAGFDFAKFFQAVKAAVQKLNWPTPIRIAAVPKDRELEAVWTKVHEGLARSTLIIAECSADGSSGGSTTADVATELTLARFRYQVPQLLVAQKGAALPQDWSDLHASTLRYERKDLPALVDQLATRLRQAMGGAVAAPASSSLPPAMEPVAPGKPAGRVTTVRAVDGLPGAVPVTAESVRPTAEERPVAAPPRPVSSPFVPSRPSGPNDTATDTTALVGAAHRQVTPRRRVGQAQPSAGPFGSEIPSTAAQAGRQAAVHFTQFEQALSAQDWSGALSAYKQAVMLDPFQHACFNPERFSPREILGAGPTGCVFRCIAQPTEDTPHVEDVALKVILRPALLAQDPDQLFNNFDLMRQVPRRSVLPISGWDRYPRGEASAYWHLWSPHQAGTVSLKALLEERGTLDEDLVIDITVQIVQGLQAIHLYYLPHLALRPSNVLLSPRQNEDGSRADDFAVWVRDVGFTPDFTQPFPPDAHWAKEVNEFAAPEQRREMPTTPGQLSDIYSLGSMLLKSLFGSPVVDVETVEKLQNLKSDTLREVIQGCVKYDPRQRYQSLMPILMALDPNAKAPQVTESPTLQLTVPRPVTALHVEEDARIQDAVAAPDMFDGAATAERMDEVAEAVGIASDGKASPSMRLQLAAQSEKLPALRGATREEGPLRDSSTLQNFAHAPTSLFPSDPLSARAHPKPTYEVAGPRSLICGIDLGTCNSTLAYVDANGDARTIAHSQDSMVTPSAVYFPQPFVAEVGQDAKQMAVFDPMNTAQFMKLVMGDPRRGRPFHGTKFSPEMISALIIRRLVEHAIQELGGPDEVTIQDVVVTVPSSWDDVRRQATALAVGLAGLNPLAVLSEPVAVALEASLESLREGKTVLVYDFGGGTFDCTIYRLDKNVVRILANLGLPTLGGTHLDQKVADHIRVLFHDEFQKDNPPDPMDRPQTKWELLTRCEEVKIALCRGAPPQTVSLTCGGFTGKYTLDRETLEKIISPEVETTMQFVYGALLEARLKADAIDLVIGVGGSSQIPLVRNRLTETFGAEKMLGRVINPQETVARGATRNAADIWAEAVRRGEVPVSALPNTLLEKLGDSPVLREETTQALSVVALDDDSPEEQIEVVIPQGTPWPARGAILGHTLEDHQMNVIVRIRSGSSLDPEGTERLGTVSFPLIPGVPKGCPLMLEFWYDGPDRLYAALWDGASGEVQQLKVPWPGPQERQVDTWRQVVAECQIVID